jgi:hypothetical protein
MWFEIDKNTSPEEIEKIFLSFKPPKPFKSEMFLGKAKWGKDGLKYQKRIRNEWE